VQVLANGAIDGLMIALLALAFSAVYVPTRVFHVALGAVYVAVPYVILYLRTLGWPWYLCLPAGILAGMVLSAACELVSHSQLDRRHASGAVHLVASLGIYIVVVQAIALLWGNDPQVLRPGVAQSLGTVGTMVTHAQVIAAACSAAVIGLSYAWLRLTGIGLRLRAVADNPEELSLHGEDPRRLRLLAFAASGIVCSIASTLMAYDTGFDPNGGLRVVLLAVVATIVGGRSSFAGPVLGGLLLGVARSGASWVLSDKWEDAVTFLLLALILVGRPQGIIARASRLEASQ
jgi:branched-chain amino acid transport system permease protein